MTVVLRVRSLVSGANKVTHSFLDEASLNQALITQAQYGTEMEPWLKAWIKYYEELWGSATVQAESGHATRLIPLASPPPDFAASQGEVRSSSCSPSDPSISERAHSSSSGDSSPLYRDVPIQPLTTHLDDAPHQTLPSLKSLGLLDTVPDDSDSDLPMLHPDKPLSSRSSTRVLLSYRNS